MIYYIIEPPERTMGLYNYFSVHHIGHDKLCTLYKKLNLLDQSMHVFNMHLVGVNSWMYVSHEYSGIVYVYLRP